MMSDNINNDLLITAVVAAKATRDYKPLIKYLESGGNIEADIGAGTALIDAAYDGDLTLISFLKDKGADLEAKGRYGGTALLWAASDGHLDAVKLLLTLGADIDAVDISGATALHWCSGFYPAGLTVNHIKVVDYLLKQGMDVNVIDDDGNTPLHWAAIDFRFVIVKGLIKANANALLTNKKGQTALDVAMGPYNIYKKGLTSGAINERQMQNMEKARSERLEDAQNIIDALNLSRNKKSMGSYSVNDLMKAAEIGNKNIMETILSSGLDVNSMDDNGDTVLSKTVEWKNAEAAELLLKKGADVNSRGSGRDMPIHIACNIDDINIVRLLIKYGADINTKGEGGYTPLMIAAAEWDMKMIKLLLDNNASIDLKNNEGKTAVDCAREVSQDVEASEKYIKLIESYKK